MQKQIKQQVRAIKQGAHYQSGQTAFFASPLIQSILNNSYGQLLVGGQYQKNRHQQKGARIYLRNFKDDGKRLLTLKSQLRQILDQGKAQIRKATLQQVSWIFPWVFSNTILFQPIRTMIFCIDQKIPETMARQIFLKIPASHINKIVNQAVLNSVKYNSGVLQTALQAVQSNILGYQTTQWSGWFNKNIQSATQSKSKTAPGFLSKILNTFSSPLRFAINSVIGIKSEIKEEIREEQNAGKNFADFIRTINGNIEQTKAFMKKLMTKITKDLRCYGQIVINFDYIRQTAKQKMVSDKILYYYPQKPDMLLGLQNSYPKVYRYLGNQLQLIPQGMFNIQYLRGLMTTQIVKLTGRVIQSVDQQYNDPQPSKKTKTQFRNNYLSWSDPISNLNRNMLNKQLELSNQTKQQSRDRSIVQKDIKQWVQHDTTNTDVSKAYDYIKNLKISPRDYNKRVQQAKYIQTQMNNLTTNQLKGVANILGGKNANDNWKYKEIRSTKNSLPLSQRSQMNMQQ